MNVTSVTEEIGVVSKAIGPESSFHSDVTKGNVMIVPPMEPNLNK